MQLLIVFRQTIVQRALLALLAEARPTWSCSVAADASEAERCLAASPFNLVFVDETELGEAPAKWIGKIHALHPEAKIVVLAPKVHQPSAIRLIEAGAHGYLDGTAPIDRMLVGVLEAVAAGAVHLVLNPACTLFSHAPDDEPSPPAVRLTPRQQAVMRHLSAGCSVKEIARRLDLSVGTVKTHLSNTYSMLGVRNRIEAISRAGFVGGV